MTIFSRSGILFLILGWMLCFSSVQAAWPSSNPQVRSTGELLTPSNWNSLVEVALEAKLRISDNIFSNGASVGIGTTTPSALLRLDVEGKIGATEYCDENGANCISAADISGVIINGIGKFIDGTIAADAVYTGGNVGIGTTTPHASALLDISSTTKGLLTPRMTEVQMNAITAPADGLLVYTTDEGEFYYWNASTTAWEAVYAGAAGFTETDPTVSAFAKTTLPTCSAGQVLKSDGTTLTCVTDTDTVLTEATVDGYANNNGYLKPDGTGNVGIGTTAPAKKLSISDGGNMGYEIDPNSGSSGITRIISYNRGTSAYAPVRYEASEIELATGAIGATQVKIDSSGNVGIGTTTPSSKLDVNGTVRITGSVTPSSGVGVELRYLTGSSRGDVLSYDRTSGVYKDLNLNDEVIIKGDSGNVGIGTTSPSSGLKLDVAGKIGATEYCDANGANCTAAASLGGSSGGSGTVVGGGTVITVFDDQGNGSSSCSTAGTSAVWGTGSCGSAGGSTGALHNNSWELNISCSGGSTSRLTGYSEGSGGGNSTAATTYLCIKN